MASTAHEVLVQDVDRAAVVIASCRLTLRDTDVDMAVGDSLRRDRFAGQLVNAVLCDPPVNDRTWGHEELVGDARWEYGVPPRGEPELAWAQHCLAHVEPGGIVAILMPPAAASRRPGRRIRAKLLRTGALRAVIALPAAGSDLWLLRRPTPDPRPPSTVLITDRVDGVETAWLEPRPPRTRCGSSTCSTTTWTSARPGDGLSRGATSAASSPRPSTASAGST